jgi:hypothetical protein
MRRIAAVALLGCSCVYARTGMLGLPATRLGPGQAETGVSAGLVYSAGAAGSGAATASLNSVQVFQFPQLEANARYGLNDLAELNLHVSSQGLLPGVKLGFSSDKIDLAVMPMLGGGVFYVGGASNATYGDFLAGLRLMVSHSGLNVYGSLGYLFEYDTQSGSSSGVGGSNTATTAHTLSLAVGYNMKVGPLLIRPEIAGLMMTGVNTSSGGFGSVGVSGVLLSVMPAVSIAAATSKEH